MTKNVHTEHCCKHHRCKYNAPECPVLLGIQDQSYPCEDCGTEGKLKIIQLYDDYECDDCGWSTSYGATVTLNDEPFLYLKPVAHCFGGEHYSDMDILKEILVKLGYEVEITNGGQVEEYEGGN